MSGRSRSYKDGLYRSLRNDEEAVNYLQAALEDSQAAFFVALRNFAEARNMAEVARNSQMDRAHLYRTLSEAGNPTFSILEKILQALGLRLAIDVEGTRVTPQTWHTPWVMSTKSQLATKVYRSLGTRKRRRPPLRRTGKIPGLSASAMVRNCDETYAMAS